MSRQRNRISIAIFAGSFVGSTLLASRSAASSLSYVYGVTDICDEPQVSPFDTFLHQVSKIEAVCNAQNENMKRGGAPFTCWPSSCLSEIKPGGTTPPQLSVDITFSDNVAGQVAGSTTSASQYISAGGDLASGSVSGGVQSSFGRTSTSGFVVRIGLTVPLGRNSDILTCVNPITMGIQVGALMKTAMAQCSGP